jgi:transposase InsO family protein
MLDEFTRECVTILVATSIHAEDVIAMLYKVFRHRGAPEFLRSDNGGEFTAQAVQTWLDDHRVGPTFIPPGQPWKNGFVESFHDKFRDRAACLQREWFQSLVEAQVVIEKWRKHYNTQRPHSALGYQTPAQFAAAHNTKRAARSVSLRVVIKTEACQVSLAGGHPVIPSARRRARKRAGHLALPRRAEIR